MKYLDLWKLEFQLTVGLLIKGGVLEKIEESNDCLSSCPLMVMVENELYLQGRGADRRDKSVIQRYDALKVNTVSSIYEDFIEFSTKSSSPVFSFLCEKKFISPNFCLYKGVHFNA